MATAEFSKYSFFRLKLKKVGKTTRPFRYCRELFNTKIYPVLCLVTQLCPTLCNPMDCSPPGSTVHGDSPGKKTGVGCHALLHSIFPTQGSKPGLPHFRQILYCLSHQQSPRILEWVAYLFSRGSSQSRNWTRVSCIAGQFFTNWATWEALKCILNPCYKFQIYISLISHDKKTLS